jgi:putative transcriptional regulator
MSITHHLDAVTLMSFAAGTLPAALSAVAASHTALCAHCRSELEAMECIGGALMADLAPAAWKGEEPMPPASAAARPPARGAAHAHDREIPRPIAALLPAGLDALQWRWIGPGVWDHALPLSGAGKLRLLKVSPSHVVPEHDHGGAELTLVLRGSFHDETGRYLRGDVADLDEGIAHKPVADRGGTCICLVASEGPERFHSLVARNWQRLRRF